MLVSAYPTSEALHPGHAAGTGRRRMSRQQKGIEKEKRSRSQRAIRQAVGLVTAAALLVLSPLIAHGERRVRRVVQSRQPDPRSRCRVLAVGRCPGTNSPRSSPSAPEAEHEGRLGRQPPAGAQRSGPESRQEQRASRRRRPADLPRRGQLRGDARRQAWRGRTCPDAIVGTGTGSAEIVLFPEQSPILAKQRR